MEKQKASAAIIKYLAITAGMVLSLGAQAQTQWAVNSDHQNAINPSGGGWVLTGDLVAHSGVEAVNDFILRGETGEHKIVIRGESVRCEATSCIINAPRLHRSGRVIYAIKAVVDLNDGRVTLEGIGPRSTQEET